MCDCKGTIPREEIERTLWVVFGGSQMNGMKHTKCGKRLSDFQLMYKVTEEDGKTRWEKEMGHQ